MGMVAATFSLTRQLIQHGPYDLVVQGGVAGAVSEGIELGDLLRVNCEYLIDLGAENRDGATLLPPVFGFPFAFPHREDGAIPIRSDAISPDVRGVTGGTVVRSSGSRSTIERLRRQYPRVEVESMEGAALAYVCRSLDQPAIQMRAVSNRVTERDRAQWKLQEAISVLGSGLSDLLDSL
jgi:futalosine hydrolase